MNIRLLIKEYISRNYIAESIQVADKKLGEDFKYKKYRQDILDVTNGDNYTYPLAMLLLNQNHHSDLEVTHDAKKLYGLLKSYNKKVFPILIGSQYSSTREELDMSNPHNFDNHTVYALKNRAKIIALLDNFDSKMLRNLRGDIAKYRDDTHLSHLQHTIQNIIKKLQDEEVVRQFDENPKNIRKLYSSKISTFDEIGDILEDFISGQVKYSKLSLWKKFESFKNSGDIKIIQDDTNVMVAEVETARAMTNLGCDISSWCFSNRFGGTTDWETYGGDVTLAVSKNGTPPEAYIILANGRIYNSHNIPLSTNDGYESLIKLGVNKEIVLDKTDMDSGDDYDLYGDEDEDY